MRCSDLTPRRAVTRPVDEQQIDQFVEAFYERVRRDPLIGPVFDAHVHDWDVHLAKMRAFWANVLLGIPGFVGDPVGTHHALAQVGPAHFDRWLELFEEVLSGVFPAASAANVLHRARRMRVALQRPTTADGAVRR